MRYMEYVLINAKLAWNTLRLRIAYYVDGNAQRLWLVRGDLRQRQFALRKVLGL